MADQQCGKGCDSMGQADECKRLAKSVWDVDQQPHTRQLNLCQLTCLASKPQLKLQQSTNARPAYQGKRVCIFGSELLGQGLAESLRGASLCAKKHSHTRLVCLLDAQPLHRWLLAAGLFEGC